ncbi:hypothetical protein GBAR_LOCUS18647, partial [Geodia barretti]
MYKTNCLLRKSTRNSTRQGDSSSRRHIRYRVRRGGIRLVVPPLSEVLTLSDCTTCDLSVSVAAEMEAVFGVQAAVIVIAMPSLSSSVLIQDSVYLSLLEEREG